MNIRKYYILFLLLFAGFMLMSQEYLGSEADRLVSGAQKVWIREGATIPSYIAFANGNEISEANIGKWLRQQFGYDESINIVTVTEEVDFRGDRHRRVKLTSGGIVIFDGMLVLHIRNNKVYALNGDIPASLDPKNQIVLGESAALQRALAHVGAEQYKWQMPEEETLLKNLTDNPDATYFPEGQLMLYRQDELSDYYYVYVFDIYADRPLYRAEVFVDAASGEILFEHNRIHTTDVSGTAVTKYSGTRTITSDSTGTTYRLRETGRGNGIETYNLQKGTNYGNAVDFTDADNYWNNVNANLDEVATDAHWGSESTYDYYFINFNRNSINNNGFKLLSYVHYSNNYANAFWDGQRMTYGDGNGSTMSPLTALDIIGHEITHGLTTFTADLVYQNEPGALNEAFSDIFGTAIEWFAKPTMANWLIGENIGSSIRSMSNPKSKGLPNTYLGQYWYTGTGDNGGVHTNNGPLCYWFYLLSQGGSGTNDNGQPYSVTGISIDSAAFIAYRMLTVYLTNSSKYSDARYYAIQSAVDLFGPCSQQVISTTNALYAIGAGPAYIPGVISDFKASMTEFCTTPANVGFTNLSNNGMSYLWDFGNGQTSTAINPIHTYTATGLFTVKLIVSGGSCGADTLVRTNYISISPQNPCSYNMPQNSTVSDNNCDGYLFDSGGNDDYQNNTNGIFVISVPGAMSITLNFSSFSFEKDYDFLYVYDGPGITSQLIGKYDGDALPNGGTITSTSGSITLRQSTDQGLTDSGFLLRWQCNYPTEPPIAAFNASDTFTCQGYISFIDVSSNGPDTWLWDLGDGNTAHTKVVDHIYTQSGIYTVKLFVSNAYGADSITKTNLVRVDLAYPDIAPVAFCDSGLVTLSNPDTSYVTKWYDSPGAVYPFYTGHSYTTPMMTQTTTFWVEEAIEHPEMVGGKLNNGGSGSYFTANAKHYLVFDVLKPSVILSVVVYAGSAGSRTFELLNSTGTVLKTLTASLTQGVNTVELNFSLQPGTGFRLAGPTSPNLYRNDGGITYPYNIGNLISITHSSASTNPTGYYYFFYQWRVAEPPCVSARIPVDVIISTAPPVADFSFTQTDPVVSFNDLTTNKGINTWNFGDGSFGKGPDPVHVYGAVGTYNVQLTVDNGCGIDNVTKAVTINSMSVKVHDSAEHLEVYPNPSGGAFSFVLPDDAVMDRNSVAFTDLAGRTVNVNISETGFNTFKVDALHLPTGIYVLSVIVNNKPFRAKVMIN